MKTGTSWIQSAVLIAVFPVNFSLAAQTSIVPTAFATAQTIFLANAGAPALGEKERLGTSMLFTTLQQQLGSWNKYKLVGNPQSADLTLEASMEDAISVFHGSSSDAVYIRLCIRDAKTQALLWMLNEPLRAAFREKTFQKNLNVSVAHLVDDLKTLASGQLPGANVLTPNSP